MADFKVSDLPIADPMTGTELMEVVQGGVSKKAVMAFLAPTAAASRNVATNAQALAGTAGVLPDAAGVHAAIRGLAVGTVSQSGGVPTGAIIERGSNANGEFTKYADGTQECWMTLAPTTVLENNFVLTNVTYPASFTAPPKMVVSASTDFAAAVGAALGTSDHSVAHTNAASRIARLNTTSSSLAVGCTVRAIGRWY